MEYRISVWFGIMERLLISIPFSNTPMKSIRLLIVDENDKNRGFVKGLLYESYLSFEVDEANTSLLALDKLKANGYDCVLTNYIIPGVSGLDVMKYARGFEVNIPLLSIFFMYFLNFVFSALIFQSFKSRLDLKGLYMFFLLIIFFPKMFPIFK